MGAVLVVAFCFTDATASEWTADILIGTAANAEGSLAIERVGRPELEFEAHWATRPFTQPLYWAARLGWAGKHRGWAVDLHHHKLYLEKGPPEVESFSITHGTNLLTIQHAWIRPRWRWLALFGVVIAHPENTIEGRALPEQRGFLDLGYELTGPVIGLGAGTELPATGWLGLCLEARITHAWLTVDVVDGSARLRDLAIHLLLGPRFRL